MLQPNCQCGSRPSDSFASLPGAFDPTKDEEEEEQRPAAMCGGEEEEEENEEEEEEPKAVVSTLKPFVFRVSTGNGPREEGDVGYVNLLISPFIFWKCNLHTFVFRFLMKYNLVESCP